MSFSPKRVYLNGNPYKIVQNSLRAKGGYGETTTRVQVFGKTTSQVPSINLETALSEVSFDLITTDSNNEDDIRVLIQTLKNNNGANTVLIEPDGAGKNQYYPNMSLMNDPDVNESPDGVVSLTFQGGKVQLT